MHDLDIDKELAELIATVRARQASPGAKHLLDRHTPGAELEEIEDVTPEEWDRAAVEKALPPVYPESAASMEFRADVQEELDTLWRTARTHPLTFKTPEFQVEARNKLEEACEALEKSHLR